MERLFSALPTPFLNNNIDFQSLGNLIEYQITNNVEGIVISGSTGEGHSLSKEEWINLIKFSSEKAKNQCAIVAGIGFNITSNAMEYAKIAEQMKVDYILATVPYYNKPQQEGIYQHFSAICNSAPKTKVILYNVPGRTVTDMSNDTIIKLVRDFSNVVALKDATGKLDRVVDLKSKLSNIKNNFTILSGEDSTQIGFNAMGGNGVISVVANLKPKLCQTIQELTKNNNYKQALEYQDELYRISQAMFCETNPVPIKYALYKLGIFKSHECRLPLVELSQTSKDLIDSVIK